MVLVEEETWEAVGVVGEGRPERNWKQRNCCSVWSGQDQFGSGMSSRDAWVKG
jgi:hypothetical protein